MLLERVTQASLHLPDPPKAHRIPDLLTRTPENERQARAQKDLDASWKKVQGITDIRGHLWGYLGRIGDLRDRYCFFYGHGDTFRDTGRPEEADKWYSRAATLATEQDPPVPLFQLAAIFSSARSFRLNDKNEKFYKTMARCLRMSQELYHEPAWLEFHCITLLRDIGLTHDAHLRNILQAAEERVASEKEKLGRPSLLVTGEGDLIGADAVARALSKIAKSPVHLEVIESPWLPQKVVELEPNALIIFGGVLARATGNLIRRFMPPGQPLR